MADDFFPLPDQAARDRIASDLETTILVEAAAGTGKTTCLITRMVNLLREGKSSIESIAALTFTRKAAAELRIRFQLALERAARESSGIAQERLRDALSQVERCFIGTMHSFCARLLRERPVEAGVDPGFGELDEAVDSQLRERAWREHVAMLIATDDPILPELESLGLKVSASTRRSATLATELDELGLEPAELGPAFLQYAEFLDVADWPAATKSMPDLKPCIEELKKYTDDMRSLTLPSDPGNDKLMPRYELILRMARQLDWNQPAQLMELLELFEGSASVVQKMWPGGKTQALAERDRWNDFQQQFAEPYLRAWRIHRYEPVLRAIAPARDVYDRLRREKNGLNYQDLLLLSARLLRDNPEVRRYFRERFTHLLVDEFQDTDPIQAEVMLLLTADDPEQANWQRCRPVPGTLFVVGDPKQSIYRFRRADILIYNKVRKIVEDVGGEVIVLSANFRSTGPIVDWVNGCFNNIFPAQADGYSPANRPLDVGRSDDSSPESAVEKLLIPESIKRSDLVADYEADRIARTIRRAIDEKMPVSRTEQERQNGVPEYAVPGDFLIVTRNKARLTAYARRLQQFGIPHAVTGGRLLNEVPELELLHLCLAAVVRSDDPVALVAVLRSELFGLADTVLYDYRRAGGRFSYHAPIPSEMPADEAAHLKDAFDRLKSYSQWLRRMPAASAIERMAADLGLMARACAAPEGDAHAGSLLKAIDLLRHAESQHTLGDVVAAVGRIVDQNDVHDGIPVRPPAELPVRIMNLHQCKGLEAPFVFLVDPSGESDHDVGVHIDRSGDEPRGYVPIYGRKRSQWGRPPLLAHHADWDQLAEAERRFLDAETNRLLYVAATRAAVKLVISQRDGKNDKSPWRLFDESLASLPPLADPGPMSSPSIAGLTIDPSDWKQEIEAIDKRWRAVLQPTYAVEAIKESALTGGPKPHGAEKHGAEWGEVLHTLLEAAMKQPAADLHNLALSALESEELPLSLADDAVATVNRVAGSELWQRAQNSERCLTEVPIALLVPESAANGLPTVLRGVIDLVFREPAGWVIVDYKSERVEESAIPALVKYYQPQIEAYAEAWENVVGQPIVERGVFFTHTGRFVAMPVL